MSRPAKRPAKKAIKKSAAPSTSSTKSAKPKSTDWKTLNDRGSDRTVEGKLESAIADFDAAIALAPNEILPRYNRGLARNLGGDVDGAIEDFDHVIELDPEFVPAYEHRGIARMNVDDLHGAVADFDAVLRLAPDKPDTLAERGAVRADLGDFEGAIQDLQRAIAVAPVDWERLDHAKDMLEAIEEAKAEQPKHAHGASHLGEHTHETPKELPTSVVEKALDEVRLAYSREDDGQGAIDYLLQVNDSSQVEAVIMRLSERFERVVLYALFKAKAKKDHRAELCEFVARANYGMGDGNFEMDVDEGSVRFKVALDFTGVSLDAHLVRNMIVNALSTIELYEDALTRVIAGKAKAKAALRAAEQAAMQRGALQ